MADASSKLTVFLQSSGGPVPTGWTETFYGLTPSLTAMLSSGQAYVAKRKELLGVGATIQAIRVSQFPLVRKTLVYYFEGNAGTGTTYTDAPLDGYDPTQVDLLIRMQSDDFHRRSFFMSGLPDSQTEQLKAQGVLNAFTNTPAFHQWENVIINQELCLRWRAGIAPDFVYDAVPITSMQPIMVRKRDRGRPFDLFRGRRLA